MEKVDSVVSAPLIFFKPFVRSKVKQEVKARGRREIVGDETDCLMGPDTCRQYIRCGCSRKTKCILSNIPAQKAYALIQVVIIFFFSIIDINKTFREL